MSATYDQTLPTAKDRIRYRLGDVDMSVPEDVVDGDGKVTQFKTALLADETILQAVVDQGGENPATAWLADGLATKYAQEPSRITIEGDLSVAFQRIDTWIALAKTIRGEITSAAAASSTGGGSVTTLRPGETSRFSGRDTEYRRDEWVGWGG